MPHLGLHDLQRAQHDRGVGVRPWQDTLTFW